LVFSPTKEHYYGGKHGVSILKKIGPSIVSAALCLLAAEVLGAAMFYRKTNSLVYFNQAKVAEPAPGVNYRRHLHPYFGYNGPYSLRGATVAETNNLGFVDSQRREVPFKPDPNDFVVFVFGGSVAVRLANNSQHGQPSLQEALQKLPQLAGRNVVIYNMAQGPAKQPQQLMELAFLGALGQHIDLVLNLDGTLEFVSGLSNFENGIDPIFPPVDIMLAIGNELAPADTSSADYHELEYGVAHARAESKRYAFLLDGSTSGIAYVKNRFFKVFYDRSLNQKLSTYDQTIAKATGWEGVRKRMGLDMPIKTSKEKIFEYVFGMWMRSSDLMKAMANSTGATYLHIVNPNPYHSKKVFTESEKALFSKSSELNYIRQGSFAGHALIESHTEMLKSRGIVSALTLFDDVADTIYIDGTGHYGRLGEEILTNFVAKQVGLGLASPQDQQSSINKLN
jgi:hypothetical protein